MRDSFLVPIPEFDEALALLSEAADAVMAGDEQGAARLVHHADMPALKDYFKRVVGPNDPAVHGTSVQPSASKGSRVKARMPGMKDELAIFLRDDWRCRFCGTRVISRNARKIFITHFPVETHWVASEYRRHSALQVLAATVDHIIPHSRGGTNDSENLVTTCTTCNFGRGAWTLDEVKLTDPRIRPPTIDGWDGLMRLVKARKRATSRSESCVR